MSKYDFEFDVSLYALEVIELAARLLGEGNGSSEFFPAIHRARTQKDKSILVGADKARQGFSMDPQNPVSAAWYRTEDFDLVRSWVRARRTSESSGGSRAGQP